MKRTKWFEREFAPIKDKGLLPGIVERLEGTPARITEKTKRLQAHISKRSDNEKWSIKKEIGHLIDLEPLWLGRKRVNRLKSGLLNF